MNCNLDLVRVEYGTPVPGTWNLTSNDTRAIQQLDEITPREPRIQRALVYYVHFCCWLPVSNSFVAGEYRHVVKVLH
jgi:hypothetical protein